MWQRGTQGPPLIAETLCLDGQCRRVLPCHKAGRAPAPTAAARSWCARPRPPAALQRVLPAGPNCPGPAGWGRPLWASSAGTAAACAASRISIWTHDAPASACSLLIHMSCSRVDDKVSTERRRVMHASCLRVKLWLLCLSSDLSNCPSHLCSWGRPCWVALTSAGPSTRLTAVHALVLLRHRIFDRRQ